LLTSIAVLAIGPDIRKGLLEGIVSAVQGR